MTQVWIDLLAAYLIWGIGLAIHQATWPGRDYSYLEVRERLCGDARLHYDMQHHLAPELISVLSVSIIILLWLPGYLVDFEKLFKD